MTVQYWMKGHEFKKRWKDANKNKGVTWLVLTKNGTNSVQSKYEGTPVQIFSGKIVYP